MFDIGMGEVLVLAVVALLVFGPDRLPVMAKQAASFIRDLRAMVANARRDLSDSVGDLGIDKEDLKTFSDMRNPKSFIRQKVLDGVDLGLDDLDVGLDDKPKKPAAKRKPVNGSAKLSTTGGGAATNGSTRSSAADDGAGDSATATAADVAAAEAAGDSATATAGAAAADVAEATASASDAKVSTPDVSPPPFDPDTT